jgi:hypothetical protein
MSYTKRTLRNLPPKSRALAEHINALELQLRRLKRLLPSLTAIELDARLVNADRAEIVAGRVITRICSWCFVPYETWADHQPECSAAPFNARLTDGAREEAAS